MSGVSVMRNVMWRSEEADIVVFCDACLTGMGFWSPSHSLAFAADTSPSYLNPVDSIFWFEALAVLSALQWVTTLKPMPRRVAIFTDNLNTVQIFDSLRSQPPYDLILIQAIQLLIVHQLEL